MPVPRLRGCTIRLPHSQGLEQPLAVGPPFAVLLGHDSADALRRHQTPGARDSIFQQRMSTVQ